MTEEIKDLFKALSPKERSVIIPLFGLNGSPRTPEEIGALYGVDKDEILKIAEQALSKIPATTEDLKAIAEKTKEEMKNKISERKPGKVLKDIDSELLNINSFKNSKK